MAGTCLVAGGGPAGMVLGLLLARAGVRVSVLEKHDDFLRDFRGDTVHPSTLRLLDQLGLGPAFRALPQSRLDRVELTGLRGGGVVLADFGRLPAPYDHVAMVPQWDLLDLLAQAARAEPTFTLRMGVEAVGLLERAGTVRGVRVRDRHTGATEELTADLVVACDGRGSTLRTAAGLPVRRYPVRFDAWWFRVPRRPDDPPEQALAASVTRGGLLVGFPRQGYIQVAYLDHKGADARLRADGVAAFRERVVALRPEWTDRVAAVASMNEVHVLDVRLDRARRWYRPGLLLVGDAAHAMSPAGGVGINLAIQDAVAAATLLAAPLRERRVRTRHLRAVQRRRLLPTVVVQTAQRVMHRQLFDVVLDARTPPALGPLQLVARRLPALTALPARLVGYGPRPEQAPAFARRGRPR